MVPRFADSRLLASQAIRIINSKYFNALVTNLRDQHIMQSEEVFRYGISSKQVD